MENSNQNSGDKKSQPMKNIAQMMDELISFEQNIKSIYEKFTDHTTKSIVTGMFQDFGSKLKELGNHLSSSGSQKSPVAAEAGHEDRSHADEEANVDSMSGKNKKSKANQTSVTRA